MNGTTLRTVALTAIVALFVSACGGNGSADPAAPSRVTFETPDGATYTVLLKGEAARKAWESLDGDGRIGIPNGVIGPGDGGINVGHDWHVTDVELADMAIEVCDGTVSYIDDLGYEEFVALHGDRFCPWDARVVDVEPAG